MIEEVKAKIQEIRPGAEIYVKNPLGDGMHFYALIVDDSFEGVSRVDRQRGIMAGLKEEMAGPIHALSLKTLTKEEFERKKEVLQKYLK